MLKYFAKTRAAAGAAAAPPSPPFSITAQTTSFGVVRRAITAPPGLIALERGGVAGKGDDLLRGPGLAGDRDREVAEYAGRGAEGVVRALVETLLDHLEVGRVEALHRSWCGRCSRRHDRAVRILDVHEHVGGHELAAVCDRRVEPCHLEGRHGQVALADGEVERVARLPDPIDPPVRVALREPVLQPGDRRYETRRLRAEVAAALRPEAEAARPLLDGLATVLRQRVEPVADAVEVRVARLGDRGREVHPLVDEAVPVVPDVMWSVSCGATYVPVQG